MRAANRGTIEETRMLNRQQAATYCGMGLSSCRAWCDSIGATRRFSERIVLFDKKIIDAALDCMEGDRDGQQ